MIQQFFNGVMALMLTKFMLNDVPHAAGLYNKGNKDLDVLYHGTSRSTAAKVLRKGKPTTKRTAVDIKVLDDLSATWRRIESDMSYDMQSALGILKEVMGYYLEEPAVTIYEGSSLIGIAVYEIGRDKDLQIDYTHIKELASFTHRPGVGRLLIEEVIKIAQEERSNEVTLSHGAGSQGFYEKLGFRLHEGKGGETGTLMVYKLRQPTGTCFPDSSHYLFQHPEGTLVHGTAVSISTGVQERINHAWVEFPDGTAWEPYTNSVMSISDFYRYTDAQVVDRYTAEEAAIMFARVGKHGPWTAEEREEYLGSAGGGIKNTEQVINLDEKLPTTSRASEAEYRLIAPFSPKWHALHVDVPRYFYHVPAGKVAFGKAIKAYQIDESEAADSFGPGYKLNKYVWLSRKPIYSSDAYIVDITKLVNNDMRDTGQIEGHILHKGDIPPSAVVGIYKQTGKYIWR